MTTSINLLLIALLIALTAFFVATEFAIVKVRGSKIDQLVAEGRKGSMAAKKVVTHLDEYLSACQLGITITALGLGWLGEPTVEKILHPLFAYMELNETLTHLLSFGIAFALVTFLHVVVGELAPKTVAIQKAEAVTLLFAGPIIWFYRIMYPFIWLLNGSARVFVGIFGLKTASEHDEVHTEEELRILLSESYQSGEINKNELKYVNNIFEFDERIAKEIMVPRKEIVSLSIDDTFTDVVETLRRENFTRYPVIDGDKDNIKGFVNMKELLTEMVTRNLEEDHFRVHSFLNPIITVIETIAIHDLLVKMQKERVHIAVLIDEYGGTAGIVTVEDILEEIVGEIRDEFDEDEVAEVRKLKDGHYLLDSKVLINEVNALLDISIDVGDLDIDTIGGWFMTHNINSKIGSVIEEEGYRFKIIEKDGIQLRYLEVTKL
ncbi:hemolysin family protein [Lysinibacillus sphaericus]